MPHGHSRELITRLNKIESRLRRELRATQIKMFSRRAIMKLFPGGVYPSDRLRLSQWQAGTGTWSILP